MTSSPKLFARNTFSSQDSAETAVGDDSADSTVSQAVDDCASHTQDTSNTSQRTQTDGLPPGYPKLADAMGLLPEVAVFRRFAYLNKLNLLHLQAELVDIEEKLKEIQREDSNGTDFRPLYARDFFYLNRSPVDGNDTQLNLLLSAREKLERYNMALIQQSFILPMKCPRKSDLGYLQKLIASKDMGPFALEGQDSNVWGSIHEPKGYAHDIVTLLPRNEEDVFSTLLTDYGVSKWFKWGFGRFRKPSQVTGLIGYNEDTLIRLTYLATTALASLLPIVSIVVLYYVHSMKARLGVIAAFNVLISFSLAFFTSAKRTDIFAVTAAFAAVQVVFVQGENSSKG